jgi:hypothetical protein
LGRETDGLLVPQRLPPRLVVAARRAVDGRHAAPLLLLRPGAVVVSRSWSRATRRSATPDGGLDPGAGRGAARAASRCPPLRLRSRRCCRCSCC